MQPPGYKIEFLDDGNRPRVQLKYPHGMTGPQPQGFAGPPLAAAILPAVTLMGAAPFQTLTAASPESLAPLAQSAPAQQPKKAPIEFDQAISYVTKIKTRFAKQPEVWHVTSM